MRVVHVCIVGSPPLARGAPSGRSCRSCLVRITPARAGSTRTARTLKIPQRDHPRSRGEHGVSWLALACARGSPPLARGALINFLNHVIRQRITPARAGSTAPLLRRCLGDADHPRSRGEHGAGLYSCPHGLGSPPLARGAPQSTTAAVVGDGITPARAGSTVQGSNATVPHRDHPRSRGEHHECVPSFVLIVGSPPLARGAPRMPLFMPEALGITPARAGSTTSSPRTTRATADHPRSRGEHGACCCGCCVVSGSPPLARGARNRSPQQSQPVRITPARAGSTSAAMSDIVIRPDHPRSRGEHERNTPLSWPPTGSPPLARGAHLDLAGPAALGRITPARAGSTACDGARGCPRTDHPRSRGEHTS